ncbi:MAG: recombinase family protein [Anaerolineales bacterium]|nr:recombinase family protein [Anaerolineales bacterium]
MTDYFPPPRDLPSGSKVWAYLRDSGGAAQENSVTQQEREVRAYCDRHGLSVVEIFKDVAKSGGSVIGRDEFERMMSASNINPPRGLLVWNFARFARDSIDSTFYKATLRKRKIIIHSMTDPIPDDEFASRIVETVIDLANEEKRRQTSRDVKRGLRELVEKGFAAGTPPRGYVGVPMQNGFKRDGSPRMVSKWERDPALWDLVALAWQMRSEGKSYREIQKATGGRLYKSNPCWHTFFRNKNYLGSFTYGGKDYPDHHDPAITWELWKAVQKINGEETRGKNHPRHPRRVGNPSLFTSYAYCAECGSMMTHTSGHKNRSWRYYICGKKDKQGAAACASRRVGEQQAEDAVINAVIEKVLTPEYLAEVIEHTRAKFSDASAIELQINNAKRALEDLEIVIQRLIRAIEKTESPSASDRLQDRERERAQVKAEIEHLESQIAASKVEITPEAMTIVLESWRGQLMQARATKDIKFVRAWLYRFVSRIELGYNHARIFYTYPMADFSHDSFPHCGGTNKT